MGISDWSSDVGTSDLAPLEELLSEEYDQGVVSAAAIPPSGIWTRKPLESLGDLKGLKIRTFDINSTRTFQRAGAAAVDMGFGDVAPALLDRKSTRLNSSH